MGKIVLEKENFVNDLGGASIERFISPEMGENCYVITYMGESVIIDPGSPIPELLKKAAELNVKYILFTHGHFDHILGLTALLKVCDAPVYIQEKDADKLTDEARSLACDYAHGIQMPYYNAKIFHDGDKFPFGDSEIVAMHTPGHSAGSSCFIFKNGIFSGDTLFCLTYGRFDFYDSNLDDLIKSLDRLTALDGDYTVYPGHNRCTTLAFEREHNRYTRLKKWS